MASVISERQPQSLHLAAICLQIQKYPLPYLQTVERLQSRCCKITTTFTLRSRGLPVEQMWHGPRPAAPSELVPSHLQSCTGPGDKICCSLNCTLVSLGWWVTPSDAWGLRSPTWRAHVQLVVTSFGGLCSLQMRTINPLPPSAPPEQSSSAEVSKLCTAHPPPPPLTLPPPPPPSQATRV